VRAHGPPVSRGDRRTSDDATKSPTLTRYNTTNMDPIQEALAAIESRDPGDNLVYQEYADFFGVDRATLARRHQGRQRSRSTQYSDQCKLTPQDELELINYIGDLEKRGLPPTRTMVQNFASTIAGVRVSPSWVTRFQHRHHNALIQKWTNGMDAERHNADSNVKYNRYFDLLHEKMETYKVQPHNTYNMDEKGFMIGVIGRSKRTFTRQAWESKQASAAKQDGNREWVTVLGASCADGSVLPPGLIFQSDNSTLQSTWVGDIDLQKHKVFTASSPSGWTNDNIGLGWLKDVFDRHTKAKARNGRDWRLLIVDGHGSHLTKAFIKYCHDRKILLSIFPPHSTHTLQPLDVVSFKPLSSSYSKKLQYHTQDSQGLLPVRKGSFFLLFWDAWVESMTEKNTRKSFKATGIWPMNREPVMKRFPPKKLDKLPNNKPTGAWRRNKQVMDRESNKLVNQAKDVSQLLHHLTVQNELVTQENNALRQALHGKKNHKKGKTLDLIQAQEETGGAIFYSPRKVKESLARQEAKEQAEEEELAEM
jgi:hypothetical protein